MIFRSCAGCWVILIFSFRYKTACFERREILACHFASSTIYVQWRHLLRFLSPPPSLNISHLDGTLVTYVDRMKINARWIYPRLELWGVKLSRSFSFNCFSLIMCPARCHSPRSLVKSFPWPSCPHCRPLSLTLDCGSFVNPFTLCVRAGVANQASREKQLPTKIRRHTDGDFNCDSI